MQSSVTKPAFAAGFFMGVGSTLVSL